MFQLQIVEPEHVCQSIFLVDNADRPVTYSATHLDCGFCHIICHLLFGANTVKHFCFYSHLRNAESWSYFKVILFFTRMSVKIEVRLAAIENN